MTPAENRPSLSAYLKTLRLRAGLTQAAAAEKIGVEREYLSRLENGKVGLGEVLAPRIARAYKEPRANLERYVHSHETKADLLEQVAALGAEVDDLRARIAALEGARRRPGSRLVDSGEG